MQAGALGLVRRDTNPGSNGFYNKLFYILIAVLGAFALVSLLNYVRSRRRRVMVLREAQRLGLMVPGMEGYVPMRERPQLRKLDGWRTPDWWEVVEDAKAQKAQRSPPTPSVEEKVKIRDIEHIEDVFHDTNTTADREPAPTPQSMPPPPNTPAPDADYGARGQLELGSIEQLRPLALIPVPVTVTEPVKPISHLPYFPNYVSYLKTAHDPKPPRFAPDDDHAFDSIIGEPLEVVVAIRMPRPPRTRVLDPDDDGAIMDEWAGLELGIASWEVVGSDR
ncbi:uncharacterized protein CcaverHIS019_0303850 [Cutaneotrichosporon cavernicola]|uniref:Uncharacterized protein n=1 Tax=Cutaneotrichosporon cavernicola TaxID=279322 RepID=A0AA48IAY7_9TREE|nr:uncharacterized protein CcaverHIS019_0303850 [Cutaneotrichosporon cavernicola]BEI90315.1 hypothetical protein CcaverHIS019_0303850 [Cutaneotrichosporon cavernicola]